VTTTEKVDEIVHDVASDSMNCAVATAAIDALYAEDRRELVKALDRLHDYYLSLGEERVDPRMVASRISALVRDPANARYGAALAKEGVVL
jgi:hypothetical protein